MKKSLVITLIVAIILVVGAYFVGLSLKNKETSEKGDGKAPTSSELKAKVAEAQVEITAKGFSPATLSVTKGTAVVWTNKDKSPHWPASDPHPKNDGLAGFDADEAIKAGESYSFTFEKEGTFGYHDHLNPTKYKGAVEVKQAGRKIFFEFLGNLGQVVDKQAAKIKSHHNLTLPEKLKFQVVEPLRDFYKDEVRSLGMQLRLPPEALFRHPFPGPGLAVRVIGEVTIDRLAILREAGRYPLNWTYILYSRYEEVKIYVQTNP